MNKCSEEYALFCEEQEMGWHRENDEREQEFISRVDAALKSGDGDAFCSMMEDPGDHLLFSKRPFYTRARLVYAIYKLNHHPDQGPFLTGRRIFRGFLRMWWTASDFYCGDLNLPVMQVP